MRTFITAIEEQMLMGLSPSLEVRYYNFVIIRYNLVVIWSSRERNGAFDVKELHYLLESKFIADMVLYNTS